MSFFKIIARPKNIFSNNLCDIKLIQQKNTFYHFNDLLKTELHFNKFEICNFNYLENNGNIEFHIDIISKNDDNDISIIQNNKSIQELIKYKIHKDDTFISLDFLKCKSVPIYNNRIFLL